MRARDFTGFFFVGAIFLQLWDKKLEVRDR